MSRVRPTTRRRLLAGLVPALLVAGALPLLAPTCGEGTEGPRTFARSSLVIPMDLCYQQQVDQVSGTGGYTVPSTCPQAADPGDVIKAYGLVYQLIRNDVAVYWVIDTAKTSLAAEDLRIQYGNGHPVLAYDWATGQPGANVTTADTVIYRGGPFVVDGADFEKASAVLQKYKGTFGGVNVHVANVAFRGYVKKTMAGGWSAGGAVPPKIALLDIGSGELVPRTTQTLCTSPSDTTNRCDSGFCISTVKNSQQVIEGYLVKAGIGGTACADPNDCPGGVAAGPHGQIYDKLTMEDFQPAAGGDWTTTNLARNGYQILWVPHWTAPGSCSAAPYNTAGDIRACACLATRYPDAKIEAALRTIGQFVAAGGDLFGECAGLGSFEGALAKGSTTTFTTSYQDGDPTTRFQTTSGVRFNEIQDQNTSVSGQQLPGPLFLPAAAPPLVAGSFGSPLLQIGDYPFTPASGAIEDYRPLSTSAYQAGVVRLIASQAVAGRTTPYGDGYEVFDYFTVRPEAPPRGTTVYLAGHSYTDRQGVFQIAGTRLVLNTLFNLGAGCTATGLACDTQRLGVCARGTTRCEGDQPICEQTVFPTPEVCNGLDDDCDGQVDEGLDQVCYDGPGGTGDVGLCRSGVRSCERRDDGTFAMGACTGQVLPATEVCNGLDDDCDGTADESISQACYFGPSTSIDPVSGQPRGVCRAGTQTCTAGSFGDCVGQVLPTAELCQAEGPGTTGVDENCDGRVDEICGCSGPPRACYTGPAGTAGHGICRLGSQACVGGSWASECTGEVTPSAEICTPPGGTPADEDCDDLVDEDCGCKPSDPPVDCYEGPAATLGVGVCVGGKQSCIAGEFQGACVGQILPAGSDPCDGADNDCDGAVDEDPSCGAGFACVSGVCVASSCGVERPCPEGYDCAGGTCVLGTCGGATCGAGEACELGQCVNRCPTDPSDPRYVSCGAGSTCSKGTGTCVGGSCYLGGCPAGQLCQDGQCAPDACAGVNCPSGTFCRQGFCVQSCAFLSCGSGQRCSTDGFCEADPCAGKACTAGQRCVAGACVADPCAGVGCGAGQVCEGGVCVDDPCTGVVCPAGRCAAGQCYPIGAAGKPSGGASESSGCGAGEAGPLSLLVLLLALGFARRRRAPAPVPVRAARRPARRLPLLALGLAAAGLGASGCKESKDPFDPASCLASAGLTVCEGESRCVDLSTDPSHCGACAIACGAGETCAASAGGGGVCGPATAVAPFLRAVSPSTGPRGRTAPVPVTLTGDRLQAGATVRVTSQTGTRTYDATFSNGSLSLSLDIADLPATTLFVRVVNPNRVISNALPFDVRTPAPRLASVTPLEIDAGEITEVVLNGDVTPTTPGGPAGDPGFFGGTRCMIRVGGVESNADASWDPADPTRLRCRIDATDLQPLQGSAIWAVNDAVPSALESNELIFGIRSQIPVLNELSPSFAEANSLASITLIGQGFDVTSRVLVKDAAQPQAPTGAQVQFFDSTRLVVPQFPLDGYDCTAGCEIRVQNGTGTPSNAKLLFEGAAPPQVNGQPSPTTAYQGETITVRFDAVDTFQAGTGIEVKGPTATEFTAIGSPLGAAAPSVSAPLSLVGAVEGSWLVRLRYSTTSTSGAYPLRVLSSQAILQDASVRGAVQGTSVQVVLTAANLRPLAAGGANRGITVDFGAAKGLVPTALSILDAAIGTGTVTVTLSTVGLSTGTHALQVVNPNGAIPSNALSFNVTPGAPTLTAVSVCTPAVPPATLCTPTGVKSAPRQEAPVLIALTGTNFARPDALGNGGSSVHIRSTDPALGVLDFLIPTATVSVKSATRIEVAFDTRTALPGFYDVQVRNPADPSLPGTPVPQTSAWLTGARGAFEILP